ncbi:bifunctional folylpolyglutamate synthase/dihydrofolate synthase [Candidatus Soleaferrea massiliensis]|uniref:bifunctional folylpolyglutamate synthase/dihydrofolate synthase n=1 Tax=Candidatus Soleaferrea massiliensis TaxID=1470354 RepID=UPI00058D456C|nr:folylpolyglutamate synthase/dihydrofolate synthase family protein [Candidatus Soleaferrea massiliensis]
MIESYSEALDYIHSLLRFGSVLGLTRIAKLLDLLGNPQKRLKFVHVAGTNGKGSTVAMTANILKTAGYKTGMYISPYVLQFRERMQINGEMIPEETLVQLTGRVKNACELLLEQDEIVTEFEAVTAIGMLWFCEQSCDIVCLEVGLGGRFDATNVIDPPLLSVITAISLDHTDILGSDIEKIAFEKCGIIKPGAAVVSYPMQSPAALAVIMESCSKNGNQLSMGNLGGVEILSDRPFGTEIRYDSLQLRISLAGRHQIANAVTVIEIIKQLRRLGFTVSDEDIRQGISTTFFPARMEILHRDPLFVLDAAHNLAGAAALADMLEAFKDRGVTLIIGMLRDKDVRGVLSKIAPYAKRILTVTPDNPRALPAAEMAEAAGEFCKSVRSFANYRDAVDAAAEQAGDVSATVICGSLYMAGDMRKTVQTAFAANR